MIWLHLERMAIEVILHLLNHSGVSTIKTMLNYLKKYVTSPLAYWTKSLISLWRMDTMLV